MYVFVREDVHADFKCVECGKTLTKYEFSALVTEQLAKANARVTELEEIIGDALNIPFPYPKSIFKMTVEEYVAAIHDPKLRTSISGLLMGDGWGGAMRQVKQALQKDQPEEATG